MDVLLGAAEDGADVKESDWVGRMLTEIQRRDEAVWAVLCQGRIVPSTESQNVYEDHWADVIVGYTVYLPERWYSWWWDDENSDQCWRALHAAAQTVCGDDRMRHTLNVERLLTVPDELTDFVAQNIARPKPRRYNSTVVQYFERDGVAWLTAPEAKLYDALKETGWLFVPQPPMLASDAIDTRPDFLIFWDHRAQYPVLIEVDSDRFHSSPSQRSKDESKERLFEARRFQYLRFSAKEVLDDPFAVIKEIRRYCTQKFSR